MHTPWAGSDRNKISGLNTVQGSTVSRYLLTSLPFCVRFNVPVTRHAATLDTGPVANSYPDGIHTHLFSNHFQYARATFFCSAFVMLSLRHVRNVAARVLSRHFWPSEGSRSNNLSHQRCTQSRHRSFLRPSPRCENGFHYRWRPKFDHQF